MRIIALLAIAIVSQATGNVLLSQGMKHIAGESQPDADTWFSMLVQAVQSPSILLGAGFLIIFFVLFAIALSRADLSFVFPATALVYVVTTLAAKFILRETVSLPRWVGTVFVCLGVGLVSFP